MPSTSKRSAAQSVARRTLAAAFVGLVLPLLAWAITMARLAVLPYEASGGAGGWGRVGQGVVILAAAVLFLLVAAWPLLWALRVRPAWHVALLAPITAMILAIALGTVAGQIIGTSIATGCVALALAYGLTALLTTPGRPWWWQQVPLAAVGGPLPMPAASPPSHLPDLGIPLIAPDLAGYTIEHLSARPGDLRYLLRPALHRAATSAEREASTITAIVRSRVDPPSEDSEYELTSPRTWRRATDTGTVYVIDRDDATIMLKGGSRVPAAVLLQATTTLRPRPPSHFTSRRHAGPA